VGKKKGTSKRKQISTKKWKLVAAPTYTELGTPGTEGRRKKGGKMGMRNELTATKLKRTKKENPTSLSDLKGGGKGRVTQTQLTDIKWGTYPRELGENALTGRHNKKEETEGQL